MSREVGKSSDEMLDEPTFAAFYVALVVISDAVSLFFIYTVVTKSTAAMKLYKFAMLKLAICDLLFNLSVSVLVSPDLLCPLPAFAVRSPIGGISETHAFVTIAITVAFGITVFFSISDCCFVRACIFYQWNAFLRKIYSWRGALFLLLANGATVSVLVLTLYLAVSTNKEFLAFVTENNLTHALGAYASRTDTVYLYVDISRPQVFSLVLFIVSVLAGVHSATLIVSRIVWRKIATRKRNMSTKSYQNHRQLTLLVLFQNLIPAAALSIPVLLIAVSAITQYESTAFVESVKHLVTFTVVTHPALSALLSFVFIHPYKKFLKSLCCCFSSRRPKRSRVSDIRMNRKVSVGNESFDSVGYI